MKKILAVLLSMCLVLALWGCSSSTPTAPATEAPTETQAPSTEAPTEEATEAPTEEPTEEVTEEPTEAPTEETCPEATEAPTEAQPEDDGSFSRGSVSVAAYENDTLGIGCTFGEDWYIFTDEEIATTMGVTAEMLTDETLTAAIENGATVCDFFARCGIYNTTNIQVGKFDNQISALSMSFLTNQQIVDATYEQLTSSGMDEALFSSLGLKDGKIEVGTVVFNGEDRPCIRIYGVMTSGTVDIPLYETEVFVMKGTHFSTITASTFFEDTTADILANYYLK